MARGAFDHTARLCFYVATAFGTGKRRLHLEDFHPYRKRNRMSRAVRVKLPELRTMWESFSARKKKHG